MLLRGKDRYIERSSDSRRSGNRGRRLKLNSQTKGVPSTGLKKDEQAASEDVRKPKGDTGLPSNVIYVLS
jgi:hypothetical protein